MTLAIANAGIGLAALNQLEQKIESDWAMAFPRGPSTAHSSIFERISRVEQLVIFYTDKTKPGSSGSFTSSSEYLKK